MNFKNRLDAALNKYAEKSKELVNLERKMMVMDAKVFELLASDEERDALRDSPIRILSKRVEEIEDEIAIIKSKIQQADKFISHHNDICADCLTDDKLMPKINYNIL